MRIDDVPLCGCWDPHISHRLSETEGCPGYLPCCLLHNRLEEPGDAPQVCCVREHCCDICPRVAALAGEVNPE